MAKTIQNMKKHIADKAGKSNKELGIFLGSSYWNSTPNDEMIEVSDIIILHGNNQTPQGVVNMINTVRGNDKYKEKPKPIIFNEDPNTDFDSKSNNMHSVITHHASWGYYDQGKNDYLNGYQSPPVNWGVSTDKKKSFFEQVRNYTK